MRQKPAARRKTYFFSDAHLGLGSPGEDRQKELRLIRFLDFIQHDAEQIFIVGDLFDYWFEYKTVVPKKYFRLFTKLADSIPLASSVFKHSIIILLALFAAKSFSMFECFKNHATMRTNKGL